MEHHSVPSSMENSKCVSGNRSGRSEGEVRTGLLQAGKQREFGQKETDGGRRKGYDNGICAMKDELLETCKQMERWE